MSADPISGIPYPLRSVAPNIAATMQAPIDYVGVKLGGLATRASVVQRSAAGATPAAGTVPLIQAFTITGALSSGIMTVTFPQAFTVVPIVTAMTINGSATAVIVNGGNVTTTNVQLIWVGAGSTTVTAHVIAIGW